MTGCRTTRTLPPRVLALLCLLAAPPLPAQYPYPQPGAVPQPPSSAPLLYLRVPGPPGAEMTFYRGAAAGQTLTAPFTVGLRPGYVYRVAVTGLPGHPGLTYYPSLEVRASLKPAYRVRPADFPAPLVISDEDFRSVRAGALVTKVIVLERPDTAIPEASRADQPIQLEVPPNTSPVDEGYERGQPLLVLRMGQREMTKADLVAQGLSGTILLPGERALGSPKVPPLLPSSCVPFHDPLLGPEPASAAMCLPDGGDVRTRAGHGLGGKLRGLDATDTVVEYQDSEGRRRVAVSNRVCICVPRFIVLRGEALPASQFAAVGPGNASVAQGGSVFQAETRPLEHDQRQGPETLGARERASSALNVTGPAAYGQVEGVQIVGRLQGTEGVTAPCKTPEGKEEDRPLLLIKWPDKYGAAIGDVVTFSLKYTNQGGRPITNVIVSDSLGGRFEYVPGSARSDRAADFTTQGNEVGSLILRWQVTDALPPGESGTVTFQVKVR